MVLVRDNGAFSANGVGPAGAPFPLSISVGPAPGSVRATAAQARELADILMSAAGDTVVVADLATISFLDERLEQWPPSRIAAARGVACVAHDQRALAAGPVGLSDEALVLRAGDLPVFLEGWHPYAFTLLGLPHRPDAGQLDALALAVGTAEVDRPVLPTLPGCTLWYSGHDDCHVAIESTDPRIAPAVLARLLALQVGAGILAATAAGAVEVTEPAGTLVAPVLAGGDHWVGRVDTDVVHLSAMPAPYRLGDPGPRHVDLVATYRRADGSWTLARP